jgi:hypothetical protein
LKKAIASIEIPNSIGLYKRKANDRKLYLLHRVGRMGFLAAGMAFTFPSLVA